MKQFFFFWLSAPSIFAETQLLPSWAKSDVLGINDLSYEQLLYLLLFIVFGIAIRFFVRFLFKRQLIHTFSRLKFIYLEKLLKKATTPLGNLVMVGFWALFLPNLQINDSLEEIIKIAIRIFACLSSVMLAYRSIDVIAIFITQKSQDKDTNLGFQLIPLFSRAMKIVVIILGGLFILQNLNVDVTSLLAGMTLGGLAFSFAAKDTVANIFGSVTIFTDQSFKVGDLIKIGSVEGTVLSVGFRSTKLKTSYNSVVTIPNSKFTDSIVDNLSLRLHRKIETTIKLHCDTSLEKIENFCKSLKDLLLENEEVQKDTFLVNFYDYGESSLDILVKFYVKANTQKQELLIREKVFFDIMILAKKMEIVFAFPTRSLLIEKIATVKINQ